MSEKFDLVRERLVDAKAIAWDTCHKIYLLMDDEQVKLMRGYGYDPLISKDDATSEQMFDLLQKWFDESCGLRFIDAVKTNEENPNAGFETLIGQFDDEDEEEAS